MAGYAEVVYRLEMLVFAWLQQQIQSYSLLFFNPIFWEIAFSDTIYRGGSYVLRLANAKNLKCSTRQGHAQGCVINL